MLSLNLNQPRFINCHDHGDPRCQVSRTKDARVHRSCKPKGHWAPVCPPGHFIFLLTLPPPHSTDDWPSSSMWAFRDTVSAPADPAYCTCDCCAGSDTCISLSLSSSGMSSFLAAAHSRFNRCLSAHLNIIYIVGRISAAAIAGDIILFSFGGLVGDYTGAYPVIFSGIFYIYY